MSMTETALDIHDANAERMARRPTENLRPASAPPRRRRPVRALLPRLGLYALVVLIVVVSVFPFYYAIITSFETGDAIFRVNYLPETFNLGNYAAVLTTGEFPRNVLNSLIVSFAVVLISLFLGVTASYALGRVRFRGRAALLLLILSVSMFPQVAVLAGLYEMMRAFGLYNSLWSLIFSYMIFTLPFTVWVLTTFMRELPVELEEAAIMDGAAPWTIITRIFLPLLGPALVTTGLLAFIAAWNEFLFALTFIISDEQRTVPVAIALISGASEFEIPWGAIMAASVIVTVPLVVLVLIFQRKIVAGLTAGSVKG
jgi:trehalose/maltose transport system permease protein